MSWLVRNLIQLNKRDEAVHFYERILKQGASVCSQRGWMRIQAECLGNFPATLTHLNIIIAGLELNQATLWGW